MLRYFLSVAGGLLLTTAAAGNDLPRIDAEVRIDGVIDESAWSQALRVELVWETDPGENIEAPVETTALLFEDGENIYVAFDARDPNPQQSGR